MFDVMDSNPDYIRDELIKTGRFKEDKSFTEEMSN